MEAAFFRYRRIAWLKDISESGASFAKSDQEKRNIIFANGISLVASLATVILLISRFFSTDNFLEGSRTYFYFGSLIFLLPILLNREGFTTLGRVAICWIPPIVVMTVSYFVLEQEYATVVSYVGVRYYLLGFCCLPFVIFNVPREKMFIVAFAVPVIAIIFFDTIFNLLGVDYSHYNSVDYEFNNVRATMSVVIIGIASYMLKSKADRIEELNSKLISELALKNQEMQRQASDKVHQLNKELFKRLQQLSEREFILNQSQRIAKIGSWEYTIEGAALFWSEEMYNIFGLDRSFNVHINNLNEILGEGAGLSVVTATNNLLKTEEPFDLMVRTKTPLGYTKWLRLYAFPIFGHDKILGARGICHDITYYKEAEERLRANDKKYRSLFEQASDSIIVIDFKGNFIDANTGFSKTFGYTLEELLDMNITQVIDSNDIIPNPILFDSLWDGNDILSERRMITKAGIIRNVEANLKRIDERHVMAIIRDVTELRGVQKQIEISEARFRGAFEYSAIGMAIVSLEGHWLKVNREFLNMVGYAEEELINHSINEIIDASDIEENIKLFEQIISGTRADYRMNKRFIRKDKNLVWTRVNVSMIKDDLSRPMYCVAQIEDMTKEEMWNEQLTMSQANLRATINNTSILIWSVDSKFTLRTFNNSFAEYSKKYCGVDLYIGMQMSAEKLDDDLRIVNTRWGTRYKRALAGEVFQFEERRFDQDLHYSINPIRGGDTIIGVSVFAENITTRKEHDRKLVEANKKIEELKLMALRSVMSPHFIFNVLNSIQFFIARNDRLNAINYLSTFSKLIRSILNHSVTNRITLSDEVDMLKNYVHLEMMRFEEKFNFVLNISADIDMESIEIPSLLVQPYVENAIIHGLYNKKSPGTLTLRVKEGIGSVVFEIEDNGVGRAEATRVREMNFPNYQSMGIRLTEERLKLLKQQNNAAFEIEDLEDESGPLGTRVKISIPY